MERCSATPACSAIVARLWPTTSCTSRAIRSRSSATWRLASSARVCSASSSRARRSRSASPNSGGPTRKNDPAANTCSDQPLSITSAATKTAAPPTTTGIHTRASATIASAEAKATAKIGPPG